MFHYIQLVILTNFIFVSSVGIKRVDCNQNGLNEAKGKSQYYLQYEDRPLFRKKSKFFPFFQEGSVGQKCKGSYESCLPSKQKD